MDCRPGIRSVYHLYTDGSAITNPKRGGWGFVCIGPDGEITGQGREENRGTNRMELIAVIKGLESINEPSVVVVYTDSLFVISKIHTPVRQDKDIYETWIALKHLLLKHEVTFKKVGSGNPDPNHKRAHHLAREAVFTDCVLQKI